MLGVKGVVGRRETGVVYDHILLYIHLLKIKKTVNNVLSEAVCQSKLKMLHSGTPVLRLSRITNQCIALYLLIHIFLLVLHILEII